MMAGQSFEYKPVILVISVLEQSRILSTEREVFADEFICELNKHMPA